MNLLDRIAYDTGGYTVQEILSSFCNKIKEIIDLVNKNEEVCDEARTIIENIRNEVVPELVNDIMKELQDKGYFDTLVNVTLIEQLRTELTTLLNQAITDYTTRLDNIDSQLDNIATINTTLENFQGETIKVVGVHNALKKGELSTDNPVVDKAKYSILLNGLENVTIDFARDSKLLINLNITENPNAILMYKCKNVIIKNLFVEGINHELLTEHQLTQGNGVYMVECENCKVENSRFKNTSGGVYILNSTDCLINKCLHEIRTEMQVYSPNKKSTGSYIITQSNNCIVMNSDSYGGTGDGNIFLSGGNGQDNCKVINCNVYNYTKGDTTKNINFKSAQGICVDGTNTNCVVQDCYVYGFAIGIDVKNFAYSTTVKNNICVSNEIGVAFRPGDQGLNNPDIFSGKILGNTINPNGGNGLNQLYPPYSNMTQLNNPIGIMLHEALDMLVDSNVIENSPSVISDFYGLVVFNDKAYNTDKNQQGISITNNQFNNASSKWTLLSKNTKPCIYMRCVNTLGVVKIQNNMFVPYFDNETDVEKIIDINYKASVLKISGNTFSKYKSLSHAISVDGALRCSISNNQFDNNSGVIQTSAPTVIDNNTISGQLWNTTQPLISLVGSSYFIINGNHYIAPSDGVETSFIKSTDINAKVSVIANTLFLRGVAPSDAIKINSANKILKNNVGSNAGGTIVDID